MQAGSILKPGLLGLCALVLIGCEDGGGFGGSGFKAQYNSARTALENGKYEQANRSYARLLTKSGPFQPRIRLEYAHSLLRSGDYARAAEQARYLASSETGQSRSAALSVLGTAEHELGIAAINRGDPEAGKDHLKAAKLAIEEVLKNHPDLDPLGALAGRLASIEVRLKALG